MWSRSKTQDLLTQASRNADQLKDLMKQQQEISAKGKHNFAEAVSTGVAEKPSEGSAKEMKGEPIGEPAEKSSDWATSKESRSSGKDTDTRDEGERTWSLMEHLRKRKVKTIHGKKELGVSSESKGLRVARKNERNYWDIYVGNLAADVTKAEIEAFLADNVVQMMDCWILSSKIYNSLSARVRIPVCDRDVVLTESFWPEGSRVRSWVMKQRQHIHEYNDVD